MFCINSIRSSDEVLLLILITPSLSKTSVFPICSTHGILYRVECNN
uniref:ORF45 n=1 Tax=Phytophthora infestans TaxID=4787 RepID=Q52V90_PHYIN|nr:ORF45 [Phytophthora infestans]AAW67071.1 ORF45 [Phytophthora infestans]ADK36698.1 unknown [Phytophthora infestans]ADZ32024.1 ORF45 [Phytophthora infestans]ADZ32032.1 ORF45 [Phytophthora infestans]